MEGGTKGHGGEASNNGHKDGGGSKSNDKEGNFKG